MEWSERLFNSRNKCKNKKLEVHWPKNDCTEVTINCTEVEMNSTEVERNSNEAEMIPSNKTKRESRLHGIKHFYLSGNYFCSAEMIST